MPQDLAALTRAAEERERARRAGEPLQAAGNALYAARGNPRSPQAEALAERAGKVLGVPPMLVDADAEAEAEMRANMDALSKAHRTAGWISTPENAAVAHDQVRNLTGIEALLTGLGNIQKAQRQVGFDLARRAGAGLYEVIGGGAYGLGLAGERALDRLGLSNPAMAQAAGALGPLQVAGFLKDVGQRNRNAARYLRGEAGAEQALSSWAPDLLPDIGYNMGFAGDVAEGVGQIGGQVLVAAGSGGMASLPTLFGQGVTQMDDRVRADQQKDGRTEYSAADDLALGAGGVVTALSEKLGLDAVMGALPAPVRARLTNKLVDIGVAGFTEGASEVAEGVGQNAIAMTLLGEDTGLLDGDLAYQGGVGATVGALARSLVMTAIPGRQHIASTQAADRALKSHEEFNAAADAVLQNPMRSYAPERFADFLKAAADPDAEVVIPAEAVATFFQSNPDLDAWMDEWDIRAQVEEAMTAGTDVVMDQATYLAKVAGTAADTAWRPDIRFGLGEMSQREAEAFRTDGGEAQLSQAVDTALEQAAEQEAQAAPERQVRDALFSQLREAGYTVDAANTQATLAARSFARRAERNPNRFADAMAAFEDAGLTVRQEFPEVLRRSMDRVDVMIEALRRGRARPSESRMFGRSMMEFLAQRGGVVDSGGELAAMNVEAWHRPSQGGKAFRRRFVRQDAAGSNDFAPDQAARAAVEAGYLPEGSGANELFAAVQAEMSGRPVYSQQFDADLQAGENAAALDELERLLGDLGLDPATADNATIKAALDRAAASDFPGDPNYSPDAAYDQSGHLNTDSPAFKAWFGDSKVVDENDEPLVVYHGTPGPAFEAFDPARPGVTSALWSAVETQRQGFYFTTDQDFAQSFADQQRGKGQGSVLPVYLSIKNPLDVRSTENSAVEAMKAVAARAQEIDPTITNPEFIWGQTGGDRFWEVLDDEQGGAAVVQAMREAGYDGLRMIEEGDGGSEVEVWVAFDPTQIKSVNNRGTFDPADPRILYQSAPLDPADDRNLVAVHNLSEANLLNVAKVGGLAVPSVAVVRGDHTFPNFGEITLVAPPALVDPKENKAAKVFGADVYSPRYPRAEVEMEPKARKALEQRLKPSAEALGEYLYLDKIEEDGLDVLDGQYGTLARIVRHAFLSERGDPAIDAEGAVRTEAINNRIDELRAEFDAWRERLTDGLVKRERIFDGYTASGRRKYLDHNLDNVVKILKRSLRDGENWNYGVGSIRSKVAPQFRSLKAIKAAKDRLVSPEEMAALKEEADQALTALGDRLQPKLKWAARFGYLDTLSEHLKEVADTRRVAGLDEYYEGLTDEDRKAVVDLLERLRTMPTEYFEAKIQRAVGLEEFVGAVVPSTISAQARKVLEDAGLRVVEYEKGDTEAAQNAARMMGVQAFRDDTFFQSTPYTGPRGQIRFSQGKAAITLFGSRDMSTFFHEFGHLTLETLIDDALDPNASPEVKADLDVVLAWFSEQAGQPITAEDVGVDQHELWARGTERYLMEGKAPSLELRDVFRTVAAWLKRIYATVLNLNAPISDDVRAVMDRLLASDEEIAQAREASGAEMGVEAFRQAGATEAEAAAYEAAVARARSDAEDDLLGRVMRAIRRQRTKEWNERADQIRPEITARVDAMPDIAAIEFITTSRTPLDRETVVAMLGDEAGLALLPKRVPPIVAATGGQHPDMVAEAGGYPSGQALLNGLMEYEAEKRSMVAANDKRSVRKARIENRVREALLDQYGDPLNDGSIEEEALAAIHSERYGDILALDLNLLARKAGQRPAPIDALRAWARERVGGRPVRDAKPGRYLKAERQASTAVQAALAKGDRAEAFRQKQAQTINNVLYVAASQAERFADAAIGRMQKMARGRNPSIHVDYMEQIDALLERFEIKAVSGRTVQRRQSLSAFIEARKEAGEPINIPAEVIEAAQKTNLADLTVDELRGLDETIKNLVHLGRMKKDLIVKGERRDLDKVADAAWASAQNLPDVRSNEAPGDKSAWENITGWGANFEASLVKAQEYFRLLDGGDIEGTFSTVLDQPGQAAADQRVKMQDEFWSPVIAAKNAVPTKVQEAWSDTLQDHPFINPNTGQPLKSMKRRDLVGAALHVGTLSNFEKMAKGYGLVSKEADAMAVSAARQGFIGWLNERLDPSEWAYVQAIWDAHERLRPTYFAVARKVEGFEPDAVEAEVVNTPTGPLRGGYAPIAYHASYDANAQRREQRDASDMFGGIMASGPRPDNGATNARTNYVGAVRLGLDDARYLAETHITYAAYAEYVTNALKFIRHPLVAQTVKMKLGEAAYRTLEPWVAGQVRDEAITDPGANSILKLARGARSNMTAAVLMGSATVLLAQPGGLAQSSIEIGPKWMAKGIANASGLLFTDNLRGFVTARSEFMRLRVEQGDLDRDFRLAMQNAKAGRGAGGKVQALKQLRDNALVFTGKAIALVDFYLVSAPTWLGAYDKAMSEGRDDAAAVYAADLAVRKTQGGGRAIDQAGVQRQNEVTKMMTFAYGWANAYYNMQRAAVVDLKNGHDRFENAIKLTALLVLPAIADAFLSGDWPEPGEDAQETIRNVAAWFARNVFFGAASGVPVLRDFAGVAERKAEGKYAGAVGQTPLGRIGDSIIKLGEDAWDLAFDPEHEVSRRWPAHVIQAVGLALGIPGTTQMTRAVNYATDVADGEQNPDSVTDWMNGLLRGPQDDQQ